MVVRHNGCESFSHPGSLLPGEGREGGLEVGLILRATQSGLEDKNDLWEQIPNAVTAKPRDLLDGGDMPGKELVRPKPVGVRSQGNVDDPRRGGIRTQPELACRLIDGGPTVAQRVQDPTD